MEGTYIKRFCFATVNRAFIDVEIDFLKSGNLKKNRALATAGLENFEIFQSGLYNLLVLELKSSLNPGQFEYNLKTHEAKETDLMLALITHEKITGLNRVFKKSPEGDVLVKRNKEYSRTVMTLEIKNDPELLKEYIEVHKPDKIWPQVLDNMDAMGILDMEIYLHGYQAFLIMDSAPEFDMERDGQQWASLPGEQEWQHYVVKFQKVEPKSKALEKWKVMKIIH